MVLCQTLKRGLEMQKLNSRTAIRLPHAMFLRLKKDAKAANIPYGELIRQILGKHYGEKISVATNPK